MLATKNNLVPESVIDRLTASHEYVFLFAKSGRTLFWVHRERPGVRLYKPPPDYRCLNDEADEEQDTAPEGWKYRPTCNDCRESVSCQWDRIKLWSVRHYFDDAEAIKEPASPNTHARIANVTENDGQGEWKLEGHEDEMLTRKGRDQRPGEIIKSMERKAGANPKAAMHEANSRQNPSFAEAASQYVPLTANKRTVWFIPTQPNKIAHFATFPEKLVEPCIMAGSSARGVCAECGAPWERTIQKTGHVNKRDPAYVPNDYLTKTDSTGWAPTAIATNIWQPTYEHQTDAVPATILDPFCGSSTHGGRRRAERQVLHWD